MLFAIFTHPSVELFTKLDFVLSHYTLIIHYSCHRIADDVIRNGLPWTYTQKRTVENYIAI